MVVRVSSAESERIRITLIAAKQCDAERRQMPELEFAKPRPHDKHDAGETRNDREPAPGADMLLQNEKREHRDEERREEDERIDLGERDRGEGDDAEHAGGGARERARLHGPGPLHAPEMEKLLVLRRGQHDADAGHQREVEADLEDGEPAAQRLDGRVAPRVDGVGEQRQQDSVVHGGLSEEEAPPGSGG